MIAEEEKARAFAHDLCAYHQPSPADVEAISAIRVAAEDFILAILRNCPASADASAAIRKVREAMMTANASIVLQELQAGC